MLNDIFDTIDSAVSIAGTCIAIVLMLLVLHVVVAIWVFKDATSRHQNAVLWLIIALFAPVIGVVIWLILRGEYDVVAPEEEERLLIFRGRKRTRRVLLAIMIVAILAIASTGVYIVDRVDKLGEEMNDFDYDQLDPITETWDDSWYLGTGDSQSIDVFEETIWWFLDLGVVFIDSIEVEVGWRDEPDDLGILVGYTNQPDTVSLNVDDSQDEISFSQQVENMQDGEGKIIFTYNDPTTVFGYGNPKDVNLRDKTVVWGDPIIAVLTLVNAGDHTHPVRPDHDDGHCEVSMSITVSGREL